MKFSLIAGDRSCGQGRETILTAGGRGPRQVEKTEKRWFKRGKKECGLLKKKKLENKNKKDYKGRGEKNRKRKERLF